MGCFSVASDGLLGAASSSPSGTLYTVSLPKVIALPFEVLIGDGALESREMVSLLLLSAKTFLIVQN